MTMAMLAVLATTTSSLEVTSPADGATYYIDEEMTWEWTGDGSITGVSIWICTDRHRSACDLNQECSSWSSFKSFDGSYGSLTATFLYSRIGDWYVCIQERESTEGENLSTFDYSSSFSVALPVGSSTHTPTPTATSCNAVGSEAVDDGWAEDHDSAMRITYSPLTVTSVVFAPPHCPS